MRLAMGRAITVLFIVSVGTFISASSLKPRGNLLGTAAASGSCCCCGDCTCESYDTALSISARALRDPANIRGQIGGVFGAYVFVVSIVCVGIFMARRRQLTATKRSKQDPDNEMMNLATTDAACAYPESVYPSLHSPSLPLFETLPGTLRPPTLGLTKNTSVLEADRYKPRRGLKDSYEQAMPSAEGGSHGRTASATHAETRLSLLTQRDPYSPSKTVSGAASPSSKYTSRATSIESLTPLSPFPTNRLPWSPQTTSEAATPSPLRIPLSPFPTSGPSSPKPAVSPTSPIYSTWLALPSPRPPVRAATPYPLRIPPSPSPTSGRPPSPKSPSSPPKAASRMSRNSQASLLQPLPSLSQFPVVRPPLRLPSYGQKAKKLRPKPIDVEQAEGYFRSPSSDSKNEGLEHLRRVGAEGRSPD